MRDSNPQALAGASFQDWCNSRSANPPGSQDKNDDWDGQRDCCGGLPSAGCSRYHILQLRRARDAVDLRQNALGLILFAQLRQGRTEDEAGSQV